MLPALFVTNKKIHNKKCIRYHPETQVFFKMYRIRKHKELDAGRNGDGMGCG
jgi:hypothetical protein